MKNQSRIKKYLCRAQRRAARGVATLPTVLALSILILAMGIGITATSLTESFISAGSKNSAQALRYAEAGARDALIKIARKKNYSTSPDYTIEFVTNGCTTNDGCARVSVSSGVGTSGDPKIVTSKGQAKTSTRTLQVSVILDSGTSVAASQYGLITSATWSELTN